MILSGQFQAFHQALRVDESRVVLAQLAHDELRDLLGRALDVAPLLFDVIAHGSFAAGCAPRPLRGRDLVVDVLAVLNVPSGRPPERLVAWLHERLDAMPRYHGWIERRAASVRVHGPSGVALEVVPARRALDSQPGELDVLEVPTPSLDGFCAIRPRALLAWYARQDEASAGASTRTMRAVRAFVEDGVAPDARPSALSLDVLAARARGASHAEAFLAALRAIEAAASGHEPIPNPVRPSEDLAARWTPKIRAALASAAAAARVVVEAAIEVQSLERTFALFRAVFPSRVPSLARRAVLHA